MLIFTCIVSLLTAAVSACSWYRNRDNREHTRVCLAICVAAGVMAVLIGFGAIPESVRMENAMYLYVSAAAILLDLILVEIRRMCLKKTAPGKAVPVMLVLGMCMAVCIARL